MGVWAYFGHAFVVSFSFSLSITEPGWFKPIPFLRKRQRSGNPTRRPADTPLLTD
jgi:hypothetical protein